MVTSLPSGKIEYESEEEKALIIAEMTKKATEEILNKVPGVAVYGLLLVPDPTHPLAKTVQDHFYELHHLTGEKFLLGVFQPPAQWSEGFKDYWRNKLGNDFESTWQSWQRGLEPGVSYDYTDLFEEPLKDSQLPCLALFTDLKEKKAIVRSLPKWNEDEELKLLINIFEKVKDCCNYSEDQRMGCLQRSLNSPQSLVSDNLAYMKDKAIDYLTKNPTEVLIYSINFIEALAGAGFLPISVTASIVIGIIKKTFSSK